MSSSEIPRHGSSNDRVCENCGRWIERAEMLYNVRIEIAAEPRLWDLEASLEKADRPPMEELEELIAKLEKLDEEQKREVEDQVYEEFRFSLCPQCRAELHRRLRSHRDILM
ncbi:MAG: hypothetical protein RLY93_04550 [Sumerlaeia bacterium]